MLVASLMLAYAVLLPVVAGFANAALACADRARNGPATPGMRIGLGIIAALWLGSALLIGAAPILLHGLPAAAALAVVTLVGARIIRR